jgi:cell division protein FtsN
MANHNQSSRTFLAIVLGGIVLALVIAAYFMYGNNGETGVRIEQPTAQKPAAEEPTANQPAAAPASETGNPNAEPSADDMSPPDDMSTPDEMPAETNSDQAPDANAPQEGPDHPATEVPAPQDPNQ